MKLYEMIFLVARKKKKKLFQAFNWESNRAGEHKENCGVGAGGGGHKAEVDNRARRDIETAGGKRLCLDVKHSLCLFDGRS